MKDRASEKRCGAFITDKFSQYATEWRSWLERSGGEIVTYRLMSGEWVEVGRIQRGAK